MDYKNLLYERQGRVGYVTLNRPEKLNALSQALLKELDAVFFDEVERDPEVRVVVVKGRGRAFSVGYDTADPEIVDVTSGIGVSADWKHLRQTQERWWRLRQLAKATIAQVHGYCLAGGTQLVMACDLIVVADNARIGNVQAGPMGAGMLGPEWAWYVGPRKAKELFFTIGSQISGLEAQRIGWANRAVPEKMLEAEVEAVAEAIARTPLELLAIEKLSINRVDESQGLRTMLMGAADLDNIAHYTPSVQKFLSRIKEKGLKRAMEEWRSGELEV